MFHDALWCLQYTYNAVSLDGDVDVHHVMMMMMMFRWNYQKPPDYLSKDFYAEVDVMLWHLLIELKRDTYSVAVLSLHDLSIGIY